MLANIRDKVKPFLGRVKSHSCYFLWSQKYSRKISKGGKQVWGQKNMRASCVRHGKEHRSRTSIRKESEGRGGDRVKCTGSHVRLEIKPCASGSEEGCKLQPERTPPQPPLLIIRCGMPAPCRWFQSLLTPPLCSAPGNASAVWSHCWHCVLAFGLCPAPRASLL